MFNTIFLSELLSTKISFMLSLKEQDNGGFHNLEQKNYKN